MDMWKGFKYAKDAGKPKNLWNLNNSVQDELGTHEQLSPKKAAVDQCLETRKCILLNGVIFINSIIIHSCRLYVNVFYVKYLIEVRTK